MNWKRPLLYTVFIVYQVSAFIFTWMVDGHLDLLGLLRYIWMFKYVTFIGVTLIIVDILWYMREKEEKQMENEALRRENDALKSRIEKENPKSHPAEKL